MIRAHGERAYGLSARRIGSAGCAVERSVPCRSCARVDFSIGLAAVGERSARKFARRPASGYRFATAPLPAMG